MDLLLECAQNFERLLPYQYHIVIGRKGVARVFTISFDRSDFHHLAGLHKLRDITQLQTGKRERIMQGILDGDLTLSTAQKSAFYEQIAPRLSPLSQLESILDNNQLVFRYNAKAHAFSMIEADYLLENQFQNNTVYLFLIQRRDGNTQVCRTMFPKSLLNYAEGQIKYTLLKKEKINTLTGDVVVQYDRLSSKQR